MQQRLNVLLNLEEDRQKYKNKLIQHQELIKIFFKKYSIGSKYFQEWDLVLKWDKKNEMKVNHTKFQKIWLDPYQIHQNIGLGTFKHRKLEGDMKDLYVNGQIIKK